MAQSSVWGRGTERTVLSQGIREDDSQLNEPSIQRRGQRDACPPRPLVPNYISHCASPTSRRAARREVGP